MAVKTQQLQIVTYPDPTLRRRAAPVERITDETLAVAERMIALMHEARGIGLAAPQVGLPWRLFVANPTGEPDDNRVYINPVLSAPSREAEAGGRGLPLNPRCAGAHHATDPNHHRGDE
jgi:peptide deformylase